MDKVTESLLSEFSTEREISHLPEDVRFEHLCFFVTVGQHHSETFDTHDISVGKATGIDGVAIIVNGSLITDAESLEEADIAGDLDVTFVFVQADRGSGFDAAKIGNFGVAVMDFFAEKPTLPQTEELKVSAHIQSEIYKRSSKFKRGNPACSLYYATTGNWTGDVVLETRCKSVVADLQSTNLFRDVEFIPVGADGIQKRYRHARYSASSEFLFEKRVAAPAIPGVTQAYLGFLPIRELLKIVSEDGVAINSSLFFSNPRDFQDYNEVNTEIKNTLGSTDKSQFVLMNNGITIIAGEVRLTGDKFLIEDYQIVNGCQTSHVLFEQAAQTDNTVMVPVRLIGTKDEKVINAIIRGTNRQTQVTEDQFFALQEFPKTLEVFFQSFDKDKKLYYERRSRQYGRLPIEKTRIITQPTVIKVFAGMFLDEPHRTTRNYSALKAKVGTGIFVKGHRMEPYYIASYALWKLEFLFRNSKVDAKYKPARFHILNAVRLLALPEEKLPPMNSHDMEKYCKRMLDFLWDPARADTLLTRAIQIVDEVAAGDFDRDKIRTETFTQQVIARCAEVNGETKAPEPSA